MKEKSMMKKGIMIAACFIIALLSMICIIQVKPVSAATVKLNKKKIYLYNGYTYKLKLKNAEGKVKFSSSDKSIATVSSKGVVTAISEGKTKIKVKNAGNTYKCTVIVMGEEPDIEEPENPDINDPKGPEDTGLPKDDQAIYEAIIALKDEYPEGTPWTNSNLYVWNSSVASGLGYSQFTGGGCQGFAMMASDAAFGEIPVYKFTDINSVRVGDILRVDNDNHSVIVLKIEGDVFTIAEGNFNSSVHWGRMINRYDCGFVYGYTRYPKDL